MLKRFVFTLLLILLSVHAVSAQQNSPAPNWLANPQLHVTALPDLLNADSTPTDLGALRIVIDTAQGRLLYQYDEKPIQSIQLPAALQKEYATNRITIAPDGFAATICHIENNDHGFPGAQFIVNFQNHQITKGDLCLMDDWWYWTRADLWQAVSPDIQYRVSVQGGYPLCSDPIASAIVIESSDSQRVATCIQNNNPGAQVQFIQWLDYDRLLMKSYSTIDGVDPTEESIILSVSTGKTASLGEDIGRIDAGLIFYDHNQKAARIAVKNYDKSPDFNVEGPVNCTLNLIDFATNQTVDVEPSYCLHDPEIHINEQARELLYINDHIPGDDAFIPVKTAHLVNLDTHRVTALPVTGTLVDILAISPDWSQFAFLVDGDSQARSGTFWPPGAFDVTRYGNPHFLIYDQRQKQVIYDKPLRHDHNPEDGSVDILPFGLSGIDWRPDGWRAVVRVEGEPLLLVEDNGSSIQETRLPNIPLSDGYNAYIPYIPLSDGYNAYWSPDGRKLLLSLADNSDYAIDLKDNSAVQVIKPNDQSLGVDWYGDNQILVEANASDQFVSNRWLIDLPV